MPTGEYITVELLEYLLYGIGHLFALNYLVGRITQNQRTIFQENIHVHNWCYFYHKPTNRVYGKIFFISDWITTYEAIGFWARVQSNEYEYGSLRIIWEDFFSSIKYTMEWENIRWNFWNQEPNTHHIIQYNVHIQV